MNLKIGLVQMDVVSDKEANLRTAESAIAELAKEGADIVVLPEMFNTPYIASNFPIYAEESGGLSYSRLSEAAKKNNVNLVGGSIPLREKDAIYNASFIFDRNGVEQGSHRKAHLFDIDIAGGQIFMESETLTPGNTATNVVLDGVNLGVCVCYDLRFPELARIMTLKGAQILIVPGAFNMTTGPAHWELLFRQRAVDNQVYTVGVAPARDEKGSYVSYANSLVCSPWGEVICRFGEKQQLAIVELDLQKVKEIREQLPLLKHRRTELYNQYKELFIGK